jgi:hypothetical protein
MVDMTENAKTEFRILIKDLPLGTVVRVPPVRDALRPAKECGMPALSWS